MKRKGNWVARDAIGAKFAKIFHSSAQKPKTKMGGYFFSGKAKCLTICAEVFEDATGIPLSPGDCIKVKFSAEIVK